MSELSAIACPSCTGSRLRLVGALPRPRAFAGRHLDDELPASDLLRCEACSLLFRFPLLSPEQYAELYRAVSAEHWPDEVSRNDWQICASYMERHAMPGASILDFGCHSGGLLALLGDRYSRTGIEINAGAAEAARKRTRADVFPSLAALPAGARFDFVTAVDVVEHFENPGSLIPDLLARVRPGGTLLISTGDADHWLWRLVGSRWWYCYFPEHVAFLSRRWLRGWLARSESDASLAVIHGFRYQRLPPARYALQALQFATYVALPRSYPALLSKLKRALSGEAFVGPPGSGLTADHLFIALRKAG